MKRIVGGMALMLLMIKPDVAAGVFRAMGEGIGAVAQGMSQAAADRSVGQYDPNKGSPFTRPLEVQMPPPVYMPGQSYAPKEDVMEEDDPRLLPKPASKVSSKRADEDRIDVELFDHEFDKKFKR